MTAVKRKPADEQGRGSAAGGKPETLSAGKRREILRAATDVFLAQGYLGANMDEIATGASVSKATVYKHFGNKKTLFEDIIRARVDGLFSPLHIELSAGGSVADVLTAFAREYVDLVLQPSSLALYRVVIFEAGHNDEIGQNSYRVGGAVTVRRIAEFLQTQVEIGRLSIDDPAMAAEQFIGSLTGHLQLRALLGVDTNPSPDRRKAHIKAAITAFLRAYSPG
ncbi:MAG: transcriptional regulator [Rhodospirillales bacterium]|jgi:AcrR family transcriptional regulator|nr:transcriptional regulator [Rhodospirillales bacterium]